MKELIAKKSAPYYYSIRDLEGKAYEEIRAFIQEDFTRHYHIQEFYELIIITKGRGVHYLGDFSYNVKKGAVFVVPPMVKHAFLSEDRMDVFHLLLHPNFFDSFSQILTRLPNYDLLFNVGPTVRQHGHIPSFLNIPDEEFDGFLEKTVMPMLRYDHPDSIFELCTAYSDALHLVCELCRYSEEVQTVSRKDETDIVSAISYINENYSKRIDIDELLKISMLSKTSFYQRFRDITGKSPSQYIISVRLASAQNMLRNTSLSIEDIATSVGFYDRAHFVKAYKNHFGISPTKYKKTFKSQR